MKNELTVQSCLRGLVVRDWTAMLKVLGSRLTRAHSEKYTFIKTLYFFEVFSKMKLYQIKCISLKHILALPTWGLRSTGSV